MVSMTATATEAAYIAAGEQERACIAEGQVAHCRRAHEELRRSIERFEAALARAKAELARYRGHE